VLGVGGADPLGGFGEGDVGGQRSIRWWRRAGMNGGLRRGGGGGCGGCLSAVRTGLRSRWVGSDSNVPTK
jgi:hypothetical protein